MDRSALSRLNVIVEAPNGPALSRRNRTRYCSTHHAGAAVPVGWSELARVNDCVEHSGRSFDRSVGVDNTRDTVCEHRLDRRPSRGDGGYLKVKELKWAAIAARVVLPSDQAIAFEPPWRETCALQRDHNVEQIGGKAPLHYDGYARLKESSGETEKVFASPERLPLRAKTVLVRTVWRRRPCFIYEREAVVIAQPSTERRFRGGWYSADQQTLMSSLGCWSYSVHW
jgi:hypothetical protein